MSYKKILNKKTILVILLVLLLLIAALIAIGITNAAGNTVEPETSQTFTEDGDGYYIWVRAVDHAGNKGPWSEAQRVWIDNKGPSAPIITGGSSEYALSRTISVSTASDDSGASGVAYYEYCKKAGSDKPADNITGTKVTTSATSQTFNTNIAGDYVFFRAVDVVGNKGAWSDGQQVYIDINKPTITVKQASLTITQGQSYNFSDYFTVAANGTNTNYTTTYKIGSTAYTNTSTLAVGTHTVTCTATKTGGNSESATMTVVVKSVLPEETTLMVACKTGSMMSYYTIPEGCYVIGVAVTKYSGVIGTGRPPDDNAITLEAASSDENDIIYYLPVTPGSWINFYVEDDGDRYNPDYGEMYIYYSAKINEMTPTHTFPDVN